MYWLLIAIYGTNITGNVVVKKIPDAITCNKIKKYLRQEGPMTVYGKRTMRISRMNCKKKR